MMVIIHALLLLVIIECRCGISGKANNSKSNNIANSLHKASSLAKDDNNEYLITKTPLTIYISDSTIKENGHFAIGHDGDTTGLRSGNFEQFNLNGQKMSEGSYKIGEYYQCCTGGGCMMNYNYKVGKWRYFYPSGRIKAVVVYKVDDFYIRTSCNGGAVSKYGKIDPSQSLQFTLSGIEMPLTNEMIELYSRIDYRVNKYSFESITINSDTVRISFLNGF